MASKFLRRAVALVPLFLAACGGGGGGGSSTGTAPTAVQLAITTGNSQAVAAESLQASASYDAVAAGGSLVTGVQVDTGAAGGPLLLADASRALLSKAQGLPALATGVSASGTEQCSGGGSITFSYDVASQTGVLSAGDTFTFDAANCIESDGTQTMRMNGSMSIRIVSGPYNPGGAYPRSVAMQTTARNFTVVMGGETIQANGDVTIALTERGFDDADVTLTSSSMTSMIGSHTITLKGYTHSVVESASGTTIQMTATIETSNSRISGSLVSYHVATTTPVVVNAAGQVTAGALKVTGANGTSLVLTATGTDSFSLQVDADGNGSYESTSTVTTTQLNALL